MRSHISPHAFRSIALIIFVAGAIVMFVSGFGAAFPLYVIALIMFGLSWYQRVG